LAGGQAGRDSGAEGGTVIVLNENTVGYRFATVRFTTIHFYGPCRVGPSTPDLWCITVAIQASFLYFDASSSFPGYMCFFFSILVQFF
jgi:hypothetical protein